MDTLTTEATRGGIDIMQTQMQGTVPVTARLPRWMVDELEIASEREQRPQADVVKRLLSRALRAGWATSFEATPTTDNRVSTEMKGKSTLAAT